LSTLTVLDTSRRTGETAGVHEIDQEAFAAAHAVGATVIDVREGYEYVGGHVPGARFIPLGHLPSQLGQIDRHGPVYVICATGNRSLAGAALLRHAGFDAFSVAGGTRDWALSGRALVTGPDAG
jgi:rhodanese-related sulfurtransferase